ncbi:arginine--tRNA ligase [Rummeliibacillus pycnus]|uniref:arginine--tRNA ligase n=1 Tax=Rummeliibacillus pycnus TaxID=101070 RepID=UPI0037C7BBD7
MSEKQQIATVIQKVINYEIESEQIIALLEKPKHAHLGDMAFPCFTLSKILRKAPNQIASEIASQLDHQLIHQTQAVGGYVNIFLNKEIITKNVIETIIKEQTKYGEQISTNESITIDFSSPNIAKPFSMGHLRSTVIGNALAKISKKNGYEVIKINHLGDWGTQFGKLIVAYKLWGDPTRIEQSPVKELLKIYVKFHEEAELDDTLNDEARAAFKRLEQGDEEALQLWQWFREASLKEFQKIYDLLGISFDSNSGEAFYNDKMENVVEELKEKQLLVESKGALVVELENMPPSLIMKKDGTTLYVTRDLAAAIYRHETYGSTKSFYVVGNEQSLHFTQLFLVLQKMGHEWANGLQHIPFGMMLKDGKKMSTRKGKIVLLEEVLAEAIDAAKKNIEEKNPSIANKEEIAKMIGIGAVVFNDLKNYRMHDIDFSLEEMLNFEGETGPYVQYTYARISSLLKKGGFHHKENINLNGLNEKAWSTILTLKDFPTIIVKSFENADPSQIAKYCLELSHQFNKYYANTKIIDESPAQNAKLALASCVAIVLSEGLRILGIKAPNEM